MSSQVLQQQQPLRRQCHKCGSTQTSLKKRYTRKDGTIAVYEGWRDDGHEGWLCQKCYFREWRKSKNKKRGRPRKQLPPERIRRDKLTIIADMMQGVVKTTPIGQEGTTRNRIFTYAHCEDYHKREYFVYLLAQGFIVQVRKGGLRKGYRLYAITKKGKHFLSMYEKIQAELFS